MTSIAKEVNNNNDTAKDEDMPDVVRNTMKLTSEIKECIAETKAKRPAKDVWMKCIDFAKFKLRQIKRHLQMMLVLRCYCAEHPGIRAAMQAYECIELGNGWRTSLEKGEAEYVCAMDVPSDSTCVCKAGIDCPFDACEHKKSLEYTYLHRSRFTLVLYASTSVGQCDIHHYDVWSIPLGYLTEETATSRVGDTFTYTSKNVDVIYRKHKQDTAQAWFTAYDLVAVRFKYTPDIDKYRDRQQEQYEQARAAIKQAKQKFEESAGHAYRDDARVKEERRYKKEFSRPLQGE